MRELKVMFMKCIIERNRIVINEIVIDVISNVTTRDKETNFETFL